MVRTVIRDMVPSDGNRVVSIYGEGIATGQATFQDEPGTWVSWDEGHMRECRMVATINEEVVGWAGLSNVSNRCVYRGIAEVSVYIADSVKGKGIGKALMETLIEASEEANIWTLQASIFEENQASIKLHKYFGFRKVGVRERIGKMTFGPNASEWRDTTIMERRSKVVGVD